MSRPPAYNHDIRCPEYGYWMPHNGNFPRPPGLSLRRLRSLHPRRCLHPADREQAVAMHGEGVSQSAVARLVGVTPPAVGRWVKRGRCRALPAAPPGAAAIGWHSGSAAGSSDCFG